ncbi:MAG: hypothetical protein KKA65_02640 [Nanoarchaeota archaeon]|nr:hypothetical protein [Nanoarchaeota archaeon]MBU4456375.1 hypothetical protein [Nanoarchaeota archaeon]MCG2719648.1 hypothetical protein [Nanoarchaeota archaeon]
MGKMSLENIWHLTSKEKWAKILESGYLEPRTILNNSKVKIPPSCLVGILPNHIKKWKEYGLLVYLKKQVLEDKYGWDEIDESKILVLNVPKIESNTLSQGYVREHKYFSPKWCNQYIEGAFKEVMTESLTMGRNSLFVNKKNRNLIMDLFLKYCNSQIDLKDYYGQFELPEFWLLQRTPVEIIKTLSLEKALKD